MEKATIHQKRKVRYVRALHTCGGALLKTYRLELNAIRHGHLTRLEFIEKLEVDGYTYSALTWKNKINACLVCLRMEPKTDGDN